MLRLRVLSWNLGPGNARWQELAAVLDGWDWDVAVLRGLPVRWPLPLATALDAEFRYTPADGPSLLARLLPLPSRQSDDQGTDAVIARRDRLVAEWPADGRRAQREGVHGALLATGVWVASLRADTVDGVTALDELFEMSGSDGLVVTGHSVAGASDRLTEVARGGEDVIWVSSALIAVAPAEVLAGGAVRGNPPLAVTLERRA